MPFLRRIAAGWNAPCGPREVLLIAAPLMVAYSAWALTWFVDRLFLMWYDPAAMAAAMPAGMAHWTLVCLPHGIAAFVNTFVAQYCGAGREKEVGRITAQGMWVGILAIPLFLLLNAEARSLFAWAEHSEKLLGLEVTYFRWLNLGAGAVVISAAQAAFFSGQGKMSVVMLVTLGGNILNAVLDYALIFGRFGCPEMGIAGAALATAISHWFNVLAFLILMQSGSYRESFGISRLPILDLRLLGRLLKFGLPSALPMLIENGAFSFLMISINGLGEQAGEATTLAFNVNAVAFAPMVGISTAAGVVVGRQLGANQEHLAARGAWSALAIGLVYSGVFGLCYIFAPDAFLTLHSLYANEAEFAELRDIVVVLLRFVAAYCLFDAAQLIFQGALRGAGDTAFILAAATVIAGTYIGLGWLMQHYMEPNLFRWWWVMTLWIATLGCVYLGRFLQGKWRSMRVIEPKVVEF